MRHSEPFSLTPYSYVYLDYKEKYDSLRRKITIFCLLSRSMATEFKQNFNLAW